ncbi:hypothetical protein ACFX2H_043347 [Malus domestica]
MSAKDPNARPIPLPKCLLLLLPGPGLPPFHRPRCQEPNSRGPPEQQLKELQLDAPKADPFTTFCCGEHSSYRPRIMASLHPSELDSTATNSVASTPRLDNSDDTHSRCGDFKPKARPVLNDNASVSDPGSPAPITSSPFCSTSSVSSIPSMPCLPPVKTRPDSNKVMETKENQSEVFTETVKLPMSQATGFAGNPGVQYMADPNYQGHMVRSLPVYYYPGQVPPTNVQVQPVPIRSQYVHQ